MIVPDANILIYAYDEGSPVMKSARQWLASSLSARIEIGFGWQTLTAFIRISTDKRVFPQPYAIKEAFEIVENWVSAPSARVLVPTSGHLRIFRRLAVDAKITGAMLMDAHLAALAIEHGATLATTDRDFWRFDGLKLINPLAKTKK